MCEVVHAAEVGVDPVGEGPLLLLEDHVVAVSVLALVGDGLVLGDDLGRLPVLRLVGHLLRAADLESVVVFVQAHVGTWKVLELSACSCWI